MLSVWLLEVSACELFYYRWLMCLLIILPAVNRWAILNWVSQCCGFGFIEYKSGFRFFGDAGTGFRYRSFFDTSKKLQLENLKKIWIRMERSLAQLVKTGNFLICLHIGHFGIPGSWFGSQFQVLIGIHWLGRIWVQSSSQIRSPWLGDLVDNSVP